MQILRFGFGFGLGLVVAFEVFWDLWVVVWMGGLRFGGRMHAGVMHAVRTGIFLRVWCLDMWHWERVRRCGMFSCAAIGIISCACLLTAVGGKLKDNLFD